MIEAASIADRFDTAGPLDTDCFSESMLPSRPRTPRIPIVNVSRRTDLLARVFLALLGPLIVIAGLESAARWFDLQAGFFLGPSASNCLNRSWLLETDLRPNCRGELSRTKLRTNSLGLRGVEIRDDGSARILAIGDSCTWGWRVKEEESYPSLLQMLLNQRYGASSYQVINAGVPGYSSYRGLVYLRERGLRLNPAIVISAYGFNDVSGGGDDEARLAQNRSLMPLLLVDDFFTLHLHFYRWARYSMSVSDPRSGDKSKRVPIDKYRRNIAEIVRLSRQHGAKVMLLNFSEFRWAPEYKAALVEISEELHVPLVSYHGPKLDIIHPKPEGYRSLVPLIVTRMEEEGWLTGRRGDGEAVPGTQVRNAPA
jgi:lysophospholipase L1-like esterase